MLMFEEEPSLVDPYTGEPEAGSAIGMFRAVFGALLSSLAELTFEHQRWELLSGCLDQMSECLMSKIRVAQAALMQRQRVHDGGVLDAAAALLDEYKQGLVLSIGLRIHREHGAFLVLTY
eukprot:TRINITY_DN39079_c0_g1_i1.p2 TRINITY_DN39079_c0_g1~~TRINITY_DN39079_c0_g1_i1.p2  ORF type:complete len:120 (-),score=36.49 TRINITY_DN39079_c0_g1_i1:48-407(-)